MTATTTVEELHKVLGKLMHRATLGTTIEMTMHDNSIVYKVPDSKGIMVVAAYQQIKKTEP